MGAGITVGRLLGQAAHQDGGQGRRHIGAVGLDRVGIVQHVGREQLVRGRPGEGWASGKQLVAQHPERVKVHPMIQPGVGGGLFRGHVGGGAERDAGGELQRGHRGIAHRLGHAEIHHHRVPPRQHHVVRLDVPMDDALLVGVAQGVRHVREDADDLGDRQPPFAREPATEALALDVGHDEVEELGGSATRRLGRGVRRARRRLALQCRHRLAGSAGIQQRQDVRMLQPRHHLDLPEEALGAEGDGEFGAQHLDGDGATVLEILRQEDQRHPSSTQLAFEAVAIAEQPLEPQEDLGHGRGMLPAGAAGA